LSASAVSVGGTNDGTLEVAGSLTVDGLRISLDPGPLATVNLTGGTIRAGEIYGLDGNEVFNFHSGTIRNPSGQDSEIRDNFGSIHVLGTANHDFYADANRSINLYANLDGSGPVRKTGSGTLNVYSSGNNSFSGSTTIASGTLALQGSASLSNSTDLTVSTGATFDMNGISDTIDGLAGGGAVKLDGTRLTVGGNNGGGTFTGVISGAGSGSRLRKIGTGTLVLGGSNTYVGTTTVSAGTMRLSGSGRLPDTTYLSLSPGAFFDLNGVSDAIDRLSGTGSVTLGGGTLTVGANNGTSTFSGVISESGNLVKSGGGTLVLSGSNTYGGTTRVKAIGTLQLSASERLPNTTDVTVDSGAFFDLNNKSETIDGLSGGGTVKLGSGTLTVGANNGASTFFGTITGSGKLVKNGSGTVVLSGDNTYTGTSTVNTGTLQVDGSIKSTGALTIKSGATLSGTGSVTGVNVLAGGTVSPGPTRKTLETGNVSFAAGATFAVELNGTSPGTSHDQLKVAGTVNLGGATLNASLGFAATGNETFVIVDNDGVDPIVGTFAGLPELSPVTLSGRVFRITYQHNGNCVALVPNQSPVSNAGFDRTADEGFAVSFNGSASWDPEGDALSYTWDFGDPNDPALGSGPAPVHVYSDNGTYTVRLISDDGFGGTSVDTATVTVRNVVPQNLSVTSQGPIADEPISAFDTVTVTALATDVAGDLPLTYEFDFDNDGSFDETNTTGIAVCSFPADGVYAVHVKVSDGDGGSATGYTGVVVGSDVPAVLPMVNFDSASQTVSEDQAVITLAVTLDAVAAHDVLVPLMLAGSAGQSDYSFPYAYVAISAGQEQTTIEIPLFNDALDEEDEETLVLEMGSPLNAVCGAVQTHTITILDDDLPPTVAFTSMSQTIAEEARRAMITATLSQISGREVVIPLSVPPAGTASAADFALVGGSNIVIPAGESVGWLAVSLTDDTEPERNETIVMSMLPPTHAVLSTLPGTTTVHTIIIPKNDAPSVSFTSAYRRVEENVGAVTVTAVLSAPFYDPVDLPFTLPPSSARSTSGGPADPRDYTLIASSPLHFAVNQTTATVEIRVEDEPSVPVAEPAETVVLEMGVPTAGALQGNTKRFVLEIAPNDFPTVSFTSKTPPSSLGQTDSNGNPWETDESGDPVAVPIRVTMNGLSAESVTVPIFKYSGAATQGTDYTLSSSITIPPGENSGVAWFNTLDDTQDEGDEQINLQLGAMEDAWVGAQSRMMFAIKDDDPVVSFTVDSQSAREDGPVKTITVQLSQPTNKAVRVPIRSTGTATNLVDVDLSSLDLSLDLPDFELISNVAFWPGTTLPYSSALPLPSRFDLIIPKYSKTATVRFDPWDELPELHIDGTLLAAEPTETQVFTIMNPSFAILGSNVRLGAVNRHTVSIQDEDLPFVSFYPNEQYYQEVREGDTIDITVSVTAPLGHDTLYVPIIARGSHTVFGVTGSATPGEDFTLSTDVLEIPASVDSASFSITTYKDRYDPMETIIVTFGTMTTATSTIETPYGNWTDPGLTILIDQPTPSIRDWLDYHVGQEWSKPIGSTAWYNVPGQIGYQVGREVICGIASLFDGYIAGATVFFDANKNGVRDFLDLNQDGIQTLDEPFEVATSTGIDGLLLLDVP
jgi:autotransporter-associated beta strand protein